jgi:hypothetical protein
MKYGKGCSTQRIFSLKGITSGTVGTCKITFLFYWRSKNARALTELVGTIILF